METIDLLLRPLKGRAKSRSRRRERWPVIFSEVFMTLRGAYCRGASEEPHRGRWSEGCGWWSCRRTRGISEGYYSSESCQKVAFCHCSCPRSGLPKEKSWIISSLYRLEVDSKYIDVVSLLCSHFTVWFLFLSSFLFFFCMKDSNVLPGLRGWVRSNAPQGACRDIPLTNTQ